VSCAYISERAFWNDDAEDSSCFMQLTQIICPVPGASGEEKEGDLRRDEEWESSWGDFSIEFKIL